MKILFDVLPIVLFFVVYKFAGIYYATGAAIGVALLQTAWSLWRHHKVEKMQLMALGLLVVLGGATLLFHNEVFIKWKPTAINWLFGGAFLGSQFFMKRTLIERLLGHAMTAPAVIWRRTNLAWGVFFVAAGALNLVVAYNFSTETWVNFKLFGLLGLTVVFALAQAFYLSRHAEMVDDKKKV